MSAQPDPLPSSSSISASGNGNIAGHGNITQTMHLPPPEKPSKFISVVVPLTAALLSAVGGAFATHEFTLARAKEKTADETETVLGIARGAIDLAKSTQASPALVAKLEELAAQSQAVQANLQLLKPPPGGAAMQADFWLPLHKGAVLGGSSSFGVNAVFGPGDIRVQLNDQASRLVAGVRLPFKTAAGKACHVIYIGPSPDGSLHGFKTTCES